MAILQTNSEPHMHTTTRSPLVQLPLELLLRVTNHLTTPELGNVRLACRHTEAALFSSFVREFFVRKAFMVSPFSLRALVEISKSRLADHMRYLHLSLDRIEPPGRDRGNQSSVQLYHHIQLHSEQASFTRAGQDIALLAEALRNLPNLQDVVIRDMLSQRRTRDGQYATWKSYGTSTICRLAGDPALPIVRREGKPDEVLTLVLNALAAADANIKGLELLLRNITMPWLGSFCFPDSQKASLVPVLARLEKLHLSVGERNRVGLGYGKDAFETMMQSFELRHFLSYVANLRELRFNGIGDDTIHEFFLDWLALPAGAKVTYHKRELTAEEQEILDASSPPVDFSKLEVLSLGRFTARSETLEKLVAKFAGSLEALELWDLTLYTKPKEEVRMWKALFTGLMNDKCGLDRLRRIKFGRLGFKNGADSNWARRAAGPVNFGAGMAEIEYLGPDWRSFLQERAAKLQRKRPNARSRYPEADESEDDDSDGILECGGSSWDEEDYEMEEDE